MWLRVASSIVLELAPLSQHSFSFREGEGSDKHEESHKEGRGSVRSLGEERNSINGRITRGKPERGKGSYS
jgi:hypothetical protein